jgi:predicted peroxiredoxin
MNDYIVLIRRRPSPEAVFGFMQDLRETLQTCNSPLVFFHGDGVEAASDPGIGWPESNPRVDWCVCRTSLERRSSSDGLPPLFRVATLVTFYQAVLSARRVESLGLGGRICCRPEQNGGKCSNQLLLEIGFAPSDQRQRREALEMALGAAALELDASVLFHGNGLEHLAGNAARAWAQITDFGLLEMYAEAPERLSGPEIAVQTVDAARVADLRARAATILIL